MLFLFLLTACGGGGGVTPVFVPRSAPTASVLNHPDPADYVSKKHRSEANDEYTVGWSLNSDPSVKGIDTHLARINAAAAYARGATGTGTTIAIVDSGIRETHREFSRGNGNKVTLLTQSGYVPDNDDKFHGTFVAALAAGNRDGGSGLNMHGVAFESSVHFTAIRLGTSDGIYRPFRLENYSELDDRSDAMFYGNIIRTAKTAGAAIVNLSFGVNGVISGYDHREIRSRFAHTAGALAQKIILDADKTILVWAAGNAGGTRYENGDPAPFDSPEVFSGLGTYFPELQSHVLAVAALDQDGSIASYSNRCGIAKAFCLAAPGSDIVSAYSDGDDFYYVGGDGTSFAAPLVSGSLALLRQYFRGQLGNTELVNRLLATANRTGIYADSDIYGHGLVDLDAATAPVGTVMTGLSNDPNSRPFAENAIALSSGAFGASLQRQLADVEVAGFDALDAPFFQSAATWVTQPKWAKRASNIANKQRQRVLVAPYRRVRQHHNANNGAGLSLTVGHGAVTDARLAFADGWWVSYRQHGGQGLGLHDYSSANPHADVSGTNGMAYGLGSRFNDPLAFAAPYLSLVRDGAGIGWRSSDATRKRFGFALMHGAPQFDDQQTSGDKRGIGVLMSMTMQRKHSATGLSLQVGAVRERTGFLGAQTQGAFGKTTAATTFAGLNGAWTLGTNDHWQLLASAYLGRTRAQTGSGLLHDVSPIVSSAFSLGAVRTSLWQADDWFGLHLAHPLRAERGRAQLRLPVGRTKYGRVVYKNRAVSLVPNARTLHAEALYGISIAGGALTTRMGLQHNAQHNKGNSHAFMRIAFERRF